MIMFSLRYSFPEDHCFCVIICSNAAYSFASPSLDFTLFFIPFHQPNRYGYLLFFANVFRSFLRYLSFPLWSFLCFLHFKRFYGRHRSFIDWDFGGFSYKMNAIGNKGEFKWKWCVKHDENFLCMLVKKVGIPIKNMSHLN